MEQLKAKLEAARTRARGLKTKKAQRKAWDAVRVIEREILTILYAERDAYATYSERGTVVHDSEREDDVAVRMGERVLWLHPTTDAQSKSWYGHTCCIKYSKGQSLVIEFEIEVDSERLCLAAIPKRSFGGTLDEAQYAELCKRDDLAFFKYPNCEGVTGLFAQPKESKRE